MTGERALNTGGGILAAVGLYVTLWAREPYWALGLTLALAALLALLWRAGRRSLNASSKPEFHDPYRKDKP